MRRHPPTLAAPLAGSPSPRPLRSAPLVAAFVVPSGAFFGTSVSGRRPTAT